MESESMFFCDFCRRWLLRRLVLLRTRNCWVLLILCRLASLISGLPFMRLWILIEEIKFACSDCFIIIVMAQVAEYFNRFFAIVIQDIVPDPLIHSEWAYFMSMFKNGPLDASRIELYLDILDKEQKKKNESKTSDRSASSVHSAEGKTYFIECSQR